MAKPKESDRRIRPEEYVDNEDDPTKEKLIKAMKRQRNLQQDHDENQVIIVADPYVTSLNGLPGVDILLDEVRQRKKRPIRNEMYEADSSVGKQSIIEYYEKINKKC